MHSPFGDHLAQLLNQKGLSQREFARRSKYAQQNVSLVIRGRRTPPLKRIPQWIKVLDLDKDSAKRLSELADLSHAPESVQALILDLRREIDALKDKVKKLSQRSHDG